MFRVVRLFLILILRMILPCLNKDFTLHYITCVLFVCFPKSEVHEIISTVDRLVSLKAKGCFLYKPLVPVTAFISSL